MFFEVPGPIPLDSGRDSMQNAGVDTPNRAICVEKSNFPFLTWKPSTLNPFFDILLLFAVDAPCWACLGIAWNADFVAICPSTLLLRSEISENGFCPKKTCFLASPRKSVTLFLWRILPLETLENGFCPKKTNFGHEWSEYRSVWAEIPPLRR